MAAGAVLGRIERYKKAEKRYPAKWLYTADLFLGL